MIIVIGHYEVCPRNRGCAKRKKEKSTRRCYENNDFLRTLQTVEDVVWQLLCLVSFSFYLLSGIRYQIMHLLARCISYPFFHVLFSICCTLIYELTMLLMAFVCD